MVELYDRKKPANWPELIGRCVVSLILVFLIQCSQFLVPHFFSDLSFFIQLLLSALMLLAVASAAGWCRRLLRVRSSAPALVFFSVLFVWLVYIAVVRQDASLLMNLLFNGQIILLIFGLCRMLSSDPGLVSYSTSPSDATSQSLVLEMDTHHLIEDIGLDDRLRRCPICKTYVKGFDHHCPAFGNCIGHKNYVLFMVLLFGFIWTESTYIVCLSQYSAESELLDGDGTRLEINFSKKVARSTMLFSILQLVWQVLFFLWHIYCICFNIRTDEWIHWKRYPEFQIVVQSEQGLRSNEMKFRNPYDKGVVQNVKEFIMASKQ
ncbi:palmitoyltransferase ZDHHC17-like [Benincasa hispida]|uniref:palmitoyltransferase ZDHHC17-like n=1 Tax=Benincasa hispida TaxID=102211 RepID=UPI001901FFE7|nr:palmitoyltransferase ZDHHC17-like [Benincasa hispida]